MPKLLSAKRMIVSLDRMLEALAISWVNIFNEQPKKESLIVLLAQGALETARYSKMISYNIGNIKSTPNDNRDYTFYKCNEILSKDTANKLLQTQKADGGKVVITKNIDDKTCVVDFYPNHKYARFLAFETLEEGSVCYLNFLYKKYNPAWSAVLAGDPSNFVHLLKVNHYFTADESQYKKSVISLYSEFLRLNIDLNNLPIVSEETKQKISNSISLSLQDLSNEIIK